ncbi:hypothetical protein P3T76_007170 [Phytophthora citrophthora]|uniref:Uncharacterized protein n=1 Tax=Phytophthora citrophthora TaxID=4793 RepID=A0AAD9LNP2_9STRA|nr:hypothetical protein P3T76_007170 [Phytophthora citrophthora]
MVMELAAWRAAVSYGAYMQPIHLHVAVSSPTSISAPATGESPSQSAQKSCQDSSKPAEALSNGNAVTEQSPEASTDQNSTPNTDQPIAEPKDVTVIPPFFSEALNGGEQIALNVGGPVWAMDWLPSKPAANAAAVAAALLEKSEKKPRRASAAKKKTKKSKKAACKGKENNQEESPEDAEPATTAASNGSTEQEDCAALEWRYLALATHPPCRVEDGKVVKNTPPDHYYDVPESARNLIQIWAVPVQRPPGPDQVTNTKRKRVKPRMVYAIDHEGGVTWDLQWCPLVKKFPKANHRKDSLGILAACFGDGSMRVFVIPKIPEERLQTEGKEGQIVEKKAPILVAKVPRIIQLSVQWSPHNWNMLLTGGSDGSVSLWNIKSAVSESGRLGDNRADREPIEPQRRFQDADTIGKQEAFDWGCGWVAIRAVAWSPFDEHLFATTGNDSVFKVWDVREPRVCLRSHRIRSTWGLSLQWMDQTSVQISGDQGSVYMYDILSGSYQKLHFHPQIDSPVWDLQFARRGAVPLLVSSCTSGSIRAAPAKKMYRTPQNCVEICRLSGEKDPSVEKPFKSLTVSFDKHSVLGSADSVSVSTREFCERDAALHRLRLSSIISGDYPCFLAAGGHAGLVILFEMQEVLDTLISTFFTPPSKKIGRPKKLLAGANHIREKGPKKLVNGQKARTLGSFAKAEGMGVALKKSNGKAKARLRAKSQKKPFIHDDGEVEEDDSVEEEEPEFEEEEEDDDESDMSLVMEDSSDDDRISASDDDIEEEPATANDNPEDARLMKEYQLDLSEEDAILLAIQMSALDEAPPVALEAGNAASSSAAPPPPQSKATKKESNASNKTVAKPRVKTIKTAAKTKRVPKAKVPPTAKAAKAKAGKGKKRARPSSTLPEPPAEPSATDADHHSNDTTDMESKAPAVATPASPSGDAVRVPKKPNKTPVRKTTPKPKRSSPMLLEAIDQAMAFQAFEYQMGMSEEDALKEALRLSEIGTRSKPSTAEAAGGPTPTQQKQIPAATPRAKNPSQKTKKKAKESKKKKQKNGDASVEEDTQRPQTPRRLEFSPLNGSEGGDQTEVPPASINSEISAEGVNASSSTSDSPPKKPSGTETSVVEAVKVASEEQKQPVKSPKGAKKTPKKPVEKKQPASASAAGAATPKDKKPAKRSRSTGAKAPPAKKPKKAATTSRRSSSGQSDVMSEEDALLLALKMSEIEY